MLIRKDFSILILLCIILIFLRFYELPVNILTWDVFGYYLYLPAAFIYKDISLSNHEWLNGIINKYETTATLYQAYSLESGNWLIRYTMGNAILILPFFLLGHLSALTLNYPADGFSVPYQLFAAAAGIFYAIFGLKFLYKILSEYFDKKIVWVIIIIIFFGTNYLQLISWDGTLLTHNFLFTFYAILIYYTIKWHQNTKLRHAVFMGLSIGLITLIRPTESVCVLIPLLWNINDFKGKIQKVRENLYHVPAAIVIIFICILPQLIYWKLITGSFFVDSYNNPGEGLDLNSPHTFKFLFSFRKGWFIYTPVMILSIIGLFQLYKKNRKAFWPIFTFFIIYLYVISSWTVWWYTGGSFSSRAIVPAYVALSIPLGYFINSIKYLKKICFAVVAICFLLILLNLFQTWQFKKGIISKDRMTKEYYFAIFGKTKVTEDDKKLLLVERSAGPDENMKSENEYVSKIIYFNDFSESSDTTEVFIMNVNKPYSPGPDIMFKDLTSTDHSWIRATAKIFIPENYNEELPVLVATFHHKGRPYKYKGKNLELNEIKYNNWNIITFDYLTPEVRSEKDNLKIYLWHRGKGDIYLDELKVEAFIKQL